MFQHMHYSVVMISDVGVTKSLVNWFGFVLPTKDQLHLFNILYPLTIDDPINIWHCLTFPAYYQLAIS